MEGFVVQPAALALAGLDRLGELAGSLLQWISPEWACMADLLRLSGIKSGDRLLDAGCGTGDLLAMAAGLEAGAMLVGLDPDEDSLELASHKIPSTLHPVELHQGVAEAMPFEDGAFDLVTATNLFGGLEPRTRARALDECFRVLRPGGRLLVADKADQPDGLEGLLLAPWILVRDAIFPGASAVPTLAEAIAIAGFEAPASRARVRTLVGTSEILEAFKPLQG